MPRRKNSPTVTVVPADRSSPIGDDSGGGEAIPRRAYKVAEVAETLAVTPQHVYSLIRKGELKAFNLGGATRVEPEEVDALIRRTTGRKNPRTGRPRTPRAG